MDCKIEDKVTQAGAGGGGTSLYFNGGGMENDASATCSHVCSLVFSIMFTLVTSQASVKEKTLRNQSGCLFSCEINIQQQ